MAKRMKDKTSQVIKLSCGGVLGNADVSHVYLNQGKPTGSVTVNRNTVYHRDTPIRVKLIANSCWEEVTSG